MEVGDGKQIKKKKELTGPLEFDPPLTHDQLFVGLGLQSLHFVQDPFQVRRRQLAPCSFRAGGHGVPTKFPRRPSNPASAPAAGVPAAPPSWPTSRTSMSLRGQNRPFRRTGLEFSEGRTMRTLPVVVRGETAYGKAPARSTMVNRLACVTTSSRSC